MSRAIRTILIICLLSCNDNDGIQLSTVTVGGLLCHKSYDEMQWLHELVEKAETDMALKGDIYAGSVDGRIIFIHQPLIMSCLACVLYDCEGNKIESYTVDHEKLRLIMKPENRIHKAYL